MKAILQRSVERLGDPGDVADVADGYAQLPDPRGLAVKAEKGTDPARREPEAVARGPQQGPQGEFESLAASLQTPIVVTAKAGEEGRLFGSVTAADIAQALSSQAGGTWTARTSTSTHRSARWGPTRCGSTSTRGGSGDHGGRTGRVVPPVACRAGHTDTHRTAVRTSVRRPLQKASSQGIRACPRGYAHSSTCCPPCDRAGRGRSDRKHPDATCAGAIHIRCPLCARRPRA